MNEKGYSVFAGDIPAKGVGALTLYDPAALRRGVDELLRLGAVTIYVSGPVSAGEREGLRLTHSHDELRLSRPWEGPTPEEGRLVLKPLSRSEGAVYLAVYNECVINRLGQATQSIADLDWLLSGEWIAGIAWMDGAPVGVYQYRVSDGCAQLDAIALLEDRRGRGLGRELLRRVLGLLEPGTVVTARVETHSPAFALLRAEGFRAEERLASWFSAEILPQ